MEPIFEDAICEKLIYGIVISGTPICRMHNWKKHCLMVRDYPCQRGDCLLSTAQYQRPKHRSDRHKAQ